MSDEDDHPPTVIDSLKSLMSTKSSAMYYRRNAKESLLSLRNFDAHTSQHFEEDRRLANWKKWLHERQKQHDMFKKTINRCSGDLVMNIAEDMKAIKEDKIAIEYTRILDPPDSQRGSPAFWRLPIAMPSRCPCIRPIEVRMSPEERCETPTLKYVGTPTAIKKEKGTIGRSQTIKENWEKCEYRKKRVDELKDRIEYVQPHKPDTDVLITGLKYPTPKEPVKLTIPVITILKAGEFCEFESEKNTYDVDNNEPTCLALKIDNSLIKKNGRAKTSNNSTYFDEDIKNTTFSVIFVKTVRNKLVSCYVRLENQGTATIRYSWKNRTAHSQTLPVTLKPKTFFFDKNCNLIPPGQILDLRFDFQSEIDGTFEESWEIILQPEITTKPIIFNFRAMTVSEKVDVSHICEYIDKNLRVSYCDHLVKSMLSKLVTKCDKKSVITSPFIDLDERDYFCLANLDKKTNQSLFSYNPEVVEQLKELYKAVKDDDDPEEWNLNVVKLIECVYRKNNLREHAPVILEIDSIVKSIISYKIDEKINRNYSKHQLVYDVLVSAIDKIENEAFDIETKYNVVKKPSVYPEEIDKNFENIFRDSNLCRFKRNEEFRPNETFAQYVPHSKIREFPEEGYDDDRDSKLIELNADQRYDLLLELKARKEELLLQKAGGKGSDKKEGKVGKDSAKSKETAKGKDKSSQSGIAKGNATGPRVDMTELLTIVPFPKHYFPAVAQDAAEGTGATLGSDQCSETIIQNDEMQLYREVLYLTTYLHLCDAVDGLAAMVDLSNKQATMDFQLGDFRSIVDSHIGGVDTSAVFDPYGDV